MIAPPPRRLVTWRLWVHEVLDGHAKYGWPHRLVDTALVVLIVANALAVMLETLPGWQDRYGGWFLAFEAFSVAVFTVEYGLRLWSCVEHRDRDFRDPVTGRLRWMATPMAIIDLLAFLPFYLSFLVPIDLRLLRLLRLVRILKITRYSPALATLGAVVVSEGRAVLGAILVMLVVAILAGSLMYTIEGAAQPEVFSSIPAALWWAIVTLTTVGYGDVVPVTTLGRMLGALVTMAGVGVFALPTAILSAGFARELRKRDFVLTVQRLTQVPVLRDLEPATMTKVAAILIPRTLPARYVVIRRGEQPDALWFIIEGTVEVDLPHRPVRLTDGDFFGEMALIGGHARSPSVVTVTDCQFLVLEADRFERLRRQMPDLADQLQRIARDRHAANTRSPDPDATDTPAGPGAASADDG
jgi:voltage-gated potassium channel